MTVTIESINRELERVREIQRERAEHIADCDYDMDDCFLSAHSDNLQEQLLRAQLSILENGGMAEFVAIETLDGELCKSFWFKGKYGETRRVEKPNGEVVYTSAMTDKGLAKKGLCKVKVKRPAWAKYVGDSLACVRVSIYEARYNRLTGEQNQYMA